MDTIYVIYEDGLTVDEWWMLEACTTYEEAKRSVNELCEIEDNESIYKIVEYKFSRTMGLMM